MRNPVRRLSLRARLALFCALLAIATGSLGVLITLSFAGSGLRTAARSAPPPPPADAPFQRPGPLDLGLPEPTDTVQARQGSAALATPSGRREQGRVVDRVLAKSRHRGLLTVAGLAVAAVVAAWLAAGRMLRPIRTMRDTAHDVVTPGSGRRIALKGPDDELHDLADTIDAMLDRLDDSFAVQRRFVADASHELRTPLAVLRTEVDVTLDDATADAEGYRASMTRLRTELSRTSGLVESLLHLSRAETLHTSVRHDLAGAAEEAIAVAKRTIRSGIVLSSALSSAPVTGDPLLLDRMTANLVENAVRYCTDDGAVTVRAGTIASTAVLVVENDGPVIDPLQVPRLFERFRRGSSDGAHRGRGDGHGLGLSIVQTVAKTHGGSVHAQARAQGGLRVEVRIPARQ